MQITVSFRTPRPITGRRGLEARENSLRCEVTSSRPCAVCRKARDRDTALGRLGPRTHAKKKGSFVSLGHRPHGSLQAQASGQARTNARPHKRLWEPQNNSKDNRGVGVSDERVLSRALLIRSKESRRERGQVRKRHRTAADKRDDTHLSL